MSLSATSERDKKMARNSLNAARILANSLKNNDFAVKIQGGDPQQSVEIPQPAFELLVEILSNMAEGKEVVVALVDQDLTTQQAADLIGVSRPYLIANLLEPGEIPFTKIGKHRRIKRSDVLAFKEKQRRITEGSLQFIADEAQKLNLGY